MARNFRCTIVTPSRAVFDDEVTYLSFPAWDGQQGVITNQSPLLTRLGIGPLRVELADGGRLWFHVDGGFAQVQERAVTILTERAARANELSVDEAEAQLADANARALAGGEDRDAVEADQQRARTRRALARSAGSKP